MDRNETGRTRRFLNGAGLRLQPGGFPVLDLLLDCILGIEESSELADLVLKTLGRDLPAGYPWPGNVRELEQAVRRVLLTGQYTGNAEEREVAGVDALVRDVRSGALNARQLMSRYCNLLYRQTGTYEEVARRTGLDRRTVRKHVLASDNTHLE